MKSAPIACLVAAALVAGHLGPVTAQAARLRHLASVYFDDAGIGLKLPEGVACGGAGRLVVGDTGNGRLLRFAYQDGKLSGGTVVKIPQVLAPSVVQLNSKGDIYTLDSRQRRIVHLSPEGEFKASLAFDGVPPPGTVVPRSFAIGPADAIHVLDAFGRRVVALDAQGKFQRALPLPDGIGFATALAVDAAGNVLLIDAIKRRLFSAAKDAGAFTPIGGDLSESVTTMPSCIAASKGVIFVVEGSGSTILGFGQDGSFLSRQLSLGWEEGELNHPTQMCINDKDEVFIADRDNSRVQVFQLTR
jgi:hypothetical protein